MIRFLTLAAIALLTCTGCARYMEASTASTLPAPARAPADAALGEVAVAALRPDVLATMTGMETVAGLRLSLDGLAAEQARALETEIRRAAPAPVAMERADRARLIEVSAPEMRGDTARIHVKLGGMWRCGQEWQGSYTGYDYLFLPRAEGGWSFFGRRVASHGDSAPCLEPRPSRPMADRGCCCAEGDTSCGACERCGAPGHARHCPGAGVAHRRLARRVLRDGGLDAPFAMGANRYHVVACAAVRGVLRSAGTCRAQARASAGGRFAGQTAWHASRCEVICRQQQGAAIQLTQRSGTPWRGKRGR